MTPLSSKAPLTSVIVNNYNYGAFLGAAIDSALAVDYPSCEVIVVDDGSTDNSRDVIAGYGSRIHTVLKENGGQASAYTAGFEASRGEVVIFLDADDRLAPHAMSTAVEMFANDAALVKLQWHLWEMDECGQVTGALVPGYELSEGDLRASVLRTGPVGYASAPASGNAWRRSFLERVMPVQSLGDRYGADAYLFTLAPVYGRLKNVATPLSYYRKHSANSVPPSLRSRLERELRWHERECEILSQHLAQQGLNISEDQWKGPDSTYAWIRDTLSLPQHLAAHLPPNSPVILCDQAELGQDFITDRPVWPFPEHEGVFAGPLRDDTHAIAELQRLRAKGATNLIFLRTTRWILDTHPLFASFMRETFGSPLETPFMTMFDLRNEIARTT